MEPERNSRHLWFWWLIFLLLIAVGTLVALHLSKIDIKLPKNQPGFYRVVKFDDGDTIEVDMNGTAETVRFIGVDTPETHKPNTPVQCYGPEASEYTKNLIGTNKVRLQADPLDTNRDRYGRLLRYVYLPDGRLVEKELIKSGYGFAYIQFPFLKSVEFKTDESMAKSAGKGLWSACQVIVEANGREQTNSAN